MHASKKIACQDAGHNGSLAERILSSDMKIFYILSLLIQLVTVGYSQQASTLDSVLAEYKAKKSEGIKRLADAAKDELGRIQKAQMQSGRLPEANAISAAILKLPITTPEGAIPPDGLPAEAIVVLRDHTFKVFAGITGLNKIFIPRFDKLKDMLLKAGDLNGANSALTKAKELADENIGLSPANVLTARGETPAQPITVEALIDGNTELHITSEGLYWSQAGGQAKPGLHEGKNEPTYVNGSRWKPKWRTKGSAGPDVCEVYAISTTAPNLTFETVQISDERFGKNEPRTPVSGAVKDNHYIITIKDPENGSRWYKLRINSVVKK